MNNQFHIHRLDGKDNPGEEHHGCRHLVLDLDHDPMAVHALRAYADAWQDTNQELANEFRTIANIYAAKWDRKPVFDKLQKAMKDCAKATDTVFDNKTVVTDADIVNAVQKHIDAVENVWFLRNQNNLGIAYKGPVLEVARRKAEKCLRDLEDLLDQRDASVDELLDDTL